MAMMDEEKAAEKKGKNGACKKASFGDNDTEDSKPTKAWREMSRGERVRAVMWVCVRVLLLLGCLYFFICSLGLLEASFQLLGGKAAGQTFQNNKLLKNPFAGLMIGVLATVLVQSSSTATSIIITMVGSKIIPIRTAIPIIMGTNIGTSVTNTLVSLAQASDRNEFRRAFSGATVHDMFNWLSVMVLLPLELAAHYLEWITGLIVDSMRLKTQGKTPEMLQTITKPFTTLIVEVDTHVIENTANQDGNFTGDSVLKRWCQVKDVTENVTHHNHLNDVSIDCQQILMASSVSSVSASLRELCAQAERHVYTDLANISFRMTYDSIDEEMIEKKISRCDNLFAHSDLHDSAVGGILLVFSLIIIFSTLYGLVKILHSVLHGSLVKVIRKFINSDLPGRAAYFTGYIFIVVGAGMTMVLQSSSVFTSTLTPMVGIGVVTVERMYPLTLGANIGTTLTGILAALSQEGDHLKNSLHVALCHLFFNLSGIMLFYPLPIMRFPIGIAKALGRTTAKHRWFAITYLILFFILLPGSVFGLSIAGWVYLAAIGGPFLVICLLIILISVLQRKKSDCLPRPLRTWDFLPKFMHSLKPIENVIFKVCRCGFCRKLQEADLGDTRSDDDNDDEADVETPSEVKHTEVTSQRQGHTNGHVMTNGAANHTYIYENAAYSGEEHRL